MDRQLIAHARSDRRLPLLTLATLVLLAGCQSFTGSKGPAKSAEGFQWPWQKDKQAKHESKYGQPVRLAVIWTPDVLSVPGKAPTRGFGGRLFFYNNRNMAIPVEGQLVVYGYDDSQPTEKKVADRKFVFTPEQFTALYSESDLGASYSIWVPWDEVGGEQCKISLLPVFTSVAGHHVAGKQSVNILEGRNRQGDGPAMPHSREWSDARTVAPVSFQESTANRPSPMREEFERGRLQTTTIELPMRVQRRLAQPQPQPPQQPPVRPSPAGSTWQSPSPTAPQGGAAAANAPGAAGYGHPGYPPAAAPPVPAPGSSFGLGRSPQAGGASLERFPTREKVMEVWERLRGETAANAGLNLAGGVPAAAGVAGGYPTSMDPGPARIGGQQQPRITPGPRRISPGAGVIREHPVALPKGASVTPQTLRPQPQSDWSPPRSPVPTGPAAQPAYVVPDWKLGR